MEKKRLWGGAALLLVLAEGCGNPPQMGEDREVFQAVDALYTAVTGKKAELVKQCENQLWKLQEEGKMPAPAFGKLQTIIAAAQSGRWQAAAEDLSWFMKGQRRSGAR